MRAAVAVAVQHNVVRAKQTTIGYTPVRYDEIHAVFDVFRVEADPWTMLHPQMRPTPAR